MINTLIQYLFILTLLVFLLFLGTTVYAAKRASSQTTIPIPVFWERIMIITFFIILVSLAFAVFVRP